MTDDTTKGDQEPNHNDKGTTSPDKPTTDTTSATSTGKAETASPWDDLGSYEDVKKRLEFARTWEKRAKDNASAAKKLADIEEAAKTETQKLQDRLTAAETELGQHRVREIRAKAARDAGLDADMAEFLTADEPEAAIAQAKSLAKRVQPPKPDLRQGARQNAKAPDDMNAWLRKAAGYNSAP
ncbi:MAG TPA: DUF4355 domain-containing protein [Pseudonocardiaceae bacterium]|nr:DUF4355 domain-containing protein [Pseudonocardiaceae bacterium]